MKQLEIPYCEFLGKDSDVGDVSSFLDTLEFKFIETRSWPEYSYKPEIRFAMAHSGDCIFIKFNVREEAVRASHRMNNSPVSQDSCVEFFISLDGGGKYYNFEFNCIGTCKAAFGPKDRRERDHLPDHIIEWIDRQALIRRGNRCANDVILWELTISIPAEVFCFNKGLSFRGLQGTANFYKCGDHLPEPHFVVWNEVKSVTPDFHLPEYFGKIRFL